MQARAHASDNAMPRALALHTTAEALAPIGQSVYFAGASLLADQHAAFETACSAVKCLCSRDPLQRQELCQSML